MRAKEFLKLLRETTTTSISAPELDGMKDLISRKIKELPDDSDTAKALKQIEDLLSHVAHGGMCRYRFWWQHTQLFSKDNRLFVIL